MRANENSSNIEPRFAVDPEGKFGTVTLDLRSYLILLVEAGVTDPHLWPPGLQDGAAALARIRQIESDCKSQHGEFDWEKLSRVVQDEYDNLSAALDRLRENAPPVPWEAYKSGEEGVSG